VADVIRPVELPRRPSVLRLCLVALPLCAALLAACSSSKVDTIASTKGTASTTTVKSEDLDMRANDFVNLKRMTAVRGFFIANRLGHLKQALAVANKSKGGTYPVGTIIQLIPGEAMVKRRAGFDSATHDWEFFSLNVLTSGTIILSRGGTNVTNRFGGNCASCHSKAAAQFDSVCEKDHGCAPLPITEAEIKGAQQADPRP
jgi:hypothetical protein